MTKLFKLCTAILAIVSCCGLVPDLSGNHSEGSASIRGVQSTSQIIRDDYITTTDGAQIHYFASGGNYNGVGNRFHPRLDVERFAVEPGAANFFGGKTRDGCRVAITRRVVKDAFGQHARTTRG
jgi:hypothetical protein